jgi:hypothetical protein
MCLLVAMCVPAARKQWAATWHPQSCTQRHHSDAPPHTHLSHHNPPPPPPPPRRTTNATAVMLKEPRKAELLAYAAGSGPRPERRALVWLTNPPHGHLYEAVVALREGRPLGRSSGSSGVSSGAAASGDAVRAWRLVSRAGVPTGAGGAWGGVSNAARSRMQMGATLAVPHDDHAHVHCLVLRCLRCRFLVCSPRPRRMTACWRSRSSWPTPRYSRCVCVFVCVCVCVCARVCACAHLDSLSAAGAAVVAVAAAGVL